MKRRDRVRKAHGVGPRQQGLLNPSRESTEGAQSIISNTAWAFLQNISILSLFRGHDETREAPGFQKGLQINCTGKDDRTNAIYCEDEA